MRNLGELQQAVVGLTLVLLCGAATLPRAALDHHLHRLWER
jgi:hypothetical protein